MKRTGDSNSIINVCWLDESGEVVNFGFALARLMRKKGINIRFVFSTADFYRQALEKGFEADFIAPKIHYGEPLSIDELERLDRKYGPPGIQSIIESTWQFDWLRLDHEQRLQIVGRAYRFWERYFDTKPTDYVILRNVGPVESRTLYNVARKHKIPYMGFSIGLMPGTFTLPDVGEDFVWRELVKAFKEPLRSLAVKERARVDKVIAHFSKKREEPVIPLTRYLPPSLLNYLYRLRRARDHRNQLSDPAQYAGNIQKMRLTNEILIWEWLTCRLFRYEKPREEKYVYFPLFHDHETTTMARHLFWCRNIPALIERLASCLPVGYRLYVKEHPYHLGQQSMARLRGYNRIPNVRVISPTVSGRSLIQKARAVVTVEGTSGWEAFLNRVPVISLGRLYYTLSPLVYKVDNIDDLEQIIWKALKAGPGIYDENIDEWRMDIWRVISTSHEGKLYPAEYPYKVPADRENMEKVADSLCQKIKRTITIN